MCDDAGEVWRVCVGEVVVPWGGEAVDCGCVDFAAGADAAYSIDYVCGW